MTNKSKIKRVNGRGGAPGLMHRPAAVEAVPSPEEGSVLTLLVDHNTLLLQGRRYPEARDLRWKKYGCCSSNCIINCYNRRFFAQQHSIRRGTVSWATGLAAVMEAV